MSAQIVVVSGPTLSGKTTLAAAIATNVAGCVHLEMDAIVDEIVVGSDHGIGDRVRGYEEMHKRASALVDQGHAVVIEGTYSRREYRESAARLLPLCNVALIECHVTMDEALRRFANRGPHRAIDLTVDRVKVSVNDFFFSGIGMTCSQDEPLQSRLQRSVALIQDGPFLDLQRWIEFRFVISERSLE
jgi:predicted kinase